MKGSVQLVSVYKAEFTDAHREITIGTLLALEVKNSSRAVHRLNCIVFIINFGEVHIFLIMIPMAGLDPQLLGEDDWCHDFNIAEFLEQLSFIFHQLIAENHSLWMEERETRSFFMEGKEVKLFSEFSMITFFCFCTYKEEMFKIFFVEECSRINTLEHLVVFIAAPVSTCNGHQLKYLDFAGCFHMRACAKVCEISLFI